MTLNINEAIYCPTPEIWDEVLKSLLDAGYNTSRELRNATWDNKLEFPYLIYTESYYEIDAYKELGPRHILKVGRDLSEDRKWMGSNLKFNFV